MRVKNNRSRFVVGALVALVLASVGWGFSFILNDGTELPIKWPPGPIQMTIIADNTAALSDGNTRAGSIRDAMISPQRGWNRYLGDAAFSPVIQAGGSGTDGNNKNEIFFSDSPYGRSWDSNTLAITTVWSRGNERGEADIIFNTAFTWDSYRGNRNGRTAIDLQRVALHELGHVLGLDHPDEDGQTVTAIMNSHVSDLDSLVADDINGAQSLYGPPGVPANDNFASAAALTLSNSGITTVTGYNTNATKEAGEPNHAGNKGGHSVWWKWIAPGDGSASLDTRGSYFDTTLAVYTGSALSSLTSIASSDDIQDGVVQASFVSFTAKANTAYWIAVDGFNND
ncbi:MAG TPA: matrixin family metalloprotease, partial [Candidatus Didemnitutus sp.]|nr:matrixin family metalloprotease [Candidatus Didemnitutus sp.]